MKEEYKRLTDQYGSYDMNRIFGSQTGYEAIRKTLTYKEVLSELELYELI